jgi:hypothetical protein
MSTSSRLPLAAALVLLASVAIAPEASAQAAGLKAGVQWTDLKLDGSAYPGVERRPAFFGGLYWTFGEGALMGQIEGLAGRMTVRRGGYDTDISTFEIPVLIRVNVLRLPKADVFVAGGGAVATRFRARNVIGGAKVDITDEIEPLDVQWIVSGGVQVHRLLLDARYTRGVRNIDALSDGGPKTTTERFGVSVGYGF